MPGYAFQVNFALLLFLGLVFNANVGDLNCAIDDFQSVGISDFLPLPLPFCRSKILDFRKLAIDVLLQFKIEHDPLWCAACFGDFLRFFLVHVIDGSIVAQFPLFFTIPE